MKSLLIVVLFGLTGVLGRAAHADDQSENDVRAGRALSLRVCSACHVVSRDQEMPPILRPPAPSFATIANRRGTTEEGVRRFLATTHSSVRNLNNMPNPELTDDQIRQAAKFLMSLRKSG